MFAKDIAEVIHCKDGDADVSTCFLIFSPVYDLRINLLLCTENSVTKLR